MVPENLASPTGVRTPDRSAHGESLSRLPVFQFRLSLAAVLDEMHARLAGEVRGLSPGKGRDLFRFAQRLYWLWDPRWLPLGTGETLFRGVAAVGK